MVAAIVGAAAVSVAVLVLWAGQPSGQPLDTDVLRYYGTNAGRIRLGDLLWAGGITALVASVWLVRGRFAKLPRRVFLGGIIGCGALLVGSSIVAWFLAGNAAAGSVGAERAAEQWGLEVALFDGAAFLLMVPVAGALAGLDRERTGGVTMTALGVLAAASLVLPVAPWNFLASLAWMAGAVVFTAHRPAEEAADAEAATARPWLAHAT